MVLSKKGGVKAHWVPCKENKQADMLSKYSLETWDFGIGPEVMAALKHQFFRPTTDKYARTSTYAAPTLGPKQRSPIRKDEHGSIDQSKLGYICNICENN